MIISDTKHRSDIDEKYHQLNRSNIARVVYWHLFFDMIKGIEGDIVECGIGRGRSLLILCALNSLLSHECGKERQIYGYDSFAGFPEPTEEDRSIRNPHKGEWATSPSGAYRYSAEFTRLVLTSADLDTVNTDLHIKKGFFADTLPLHPERPIALLHIDGDLYQSYMTALQCLYPLVARGGIIIFDDFSISCPEEKDPFPGSRRAVKEFLREQFDSVQESILGNCYLIKE